MGSMEITKGLWLDLQRREIVSQGAVEVLPEMEFRLLALLVENRGRAVSMARIVKLVWHPDGPPAKAAGKNAPLFLRALVFRLRSRLDRRAHIQAVSGKGYRLAGR